MSKQGQGDPPPVKHSASCPGSDQYLACLRVKEVDPLLNAWVDHPLGSTAIRTGESRRGSEQTTDQRALIVDLTTILAKVRAVQVGKRCRMLRFAFDRQPCHLFTGGRHRPAAIVTAGLAFEGWNTRS